VYDIRKNSTTQQETPTYTFCPRHLLQSGLSNHIRGHITGVAFHKDEILASYSGDNIYLFNIKTTINTNTKKRKRGSTPLMREQEEEIPTSSGNYFEQQYSGHCNVRTVKGVSFFGPEGEYVASGSDDGRIFIWEKKNWKIN